MRYFFSRWMLLGPALRGRFWEASLHKLLSRWVLVFGALLGPLSANVGTAESLLVNIIQGQGDVTSSPAGINCDNSGGEITDCSESNLGSSDLVLDLTAIPSQGWQIGAWGDSCVASGSAPTCTITLQPDVISTALRIASLVFEEQVLTVLTVGSGSGLVFDEILGIECVSGFEGACAEPFGNSTSTTLEAVADEGSVFLGWGDGGASCGTASTCTVAADIVTVTALFDLEVVEEQVLTVSTTGSGSGLVTDDGSLGIECATGLEASCSEPFGNNTSTTLTATQEPGSLFVGWSGGGCTGTGSCIVTASIVTVTAQFELDSDDDLVPEPPDACLSTPPNEAVDVNGCSASQLDDDGDNVTNDLDQCPATPQGETVDTNGCSDSQLDDDDDGVTNDLDQCPETPSGESVDAEGCSTLELDEDMDGVSDELDQCPATPAGEAVDGEGCAASQLDDDEDGVSNDLDQCPATPLDEPVDSSGCSDSQLDDDGDGVSNAIDQCPETPAGESVDAVGCSDTELDDDEDGVFNDLDQCPNTEVSSPVDSDGCADSQKDSDGDGINDEDDSCPNSDADLPVDEDGCSEVQQFGNELGELPGLSENEQSLGSRIDEVCPQLIGLDVEEGLTAGQQQLRSACSRLKNRGTSQDQAISALGQISLTELASLTQNAVQSGMTQARGTQRRVSQVNAGGGGGVSVAGLNLRSGNQVVPAHVLESAFKGLLGMGASEDSFADFGKLGIYLQGDFDFGDRDETSRESGYDFDAWNVSVGADYRFTDSVYAGASLGFGEIEVDYARNGGESDISNWTLSTYAGWQITERWFLDGMFSYGESDFDTVRRINYTDIGGQFESSQKGSTDGDQIFLGLNTGYMFNREGWRFGPIASLTYLDGSIDGYTERAQGDSSDAWSFLVEDQDYESLRISAGGQLDYAISTSFGVLIPGIRATWVYEAEDGAEQIGLRLANNPFAESSLDSSQIMIETDGVDSNFLDASFNLSGQFVMGVSGYMSYQFYSSYDNYSQSGFTIGLRWDKPF